MITPRISMVAYECRHPGFIFVAVPNERGRYIRTDYSVANVACPQCGAAIGEPCLSRGKPGHTDAKYGGGTHVARRRVNCRGARGNDLLDQDRIPDPTPIEEMEPAA